MPSPDNTSFVRVVRDLRAMATSLPPGARLPSMRELASRLGVSPVTVQQSMAKLAREGLVVSRPGHGTFVAQRRALPGSSEDYSWQGVALGSSRPPLHGLEQLLALPRPGTVSLSSGFLDAGLQPHGLLGPAMARAARRPGAWGRVPVEGTEELRSFFAAELGGDLRAHNVLVTPGGQAALSGCFRALAAPGETVVIESPTYIGAIAAARAAGLHLVPVPTDAEGIRPELLDRALRSSAARLCYCQPRYANPTGALMSPARRAAVMEVVTAAGAFLIEDDWVRDLDLEGPSPPAMASDDHEGHVVHLRSLTKAVAPGLRVGALIARGPVLARLRSLRIVDDFFVAPPLQEVALEVLVSPAWQRHLKAVRTELRARREALVSALAQFWPDVEVPIVPRGGLHLWVRLPDGVDDVRFAEEAALARVTVNPGRDWFPAEPPGPFLRLSYAGAEQAALVEAVTTLASSLGAASSRARTLR